MSLEDLQSDLDELRDELKTATDALSSAESCETMSDYLANLAELLEAARDLSRKTKNALAIANEPNEDE